MARMFNEPLAHQIFWQTWRDLVFIHWEIDPAILSAVLPPRIEPDLFEGKAYVGLVPFRMTDIRSVWLPPVPGTSNTLETNVRTYVKRRNLTHEPVPAVWFFSLEAQSTLAVLLARFHYGLAYCKATMTFEKVTDSSGLDVYSATSTRCWPKPIPAVSSLTAEFRSDRPHTPAAPNTLEYFLIERYALYATRRGRLTYARVSHNPYQVRAGAVRDVNAGLLVAAGLPEPSPEATVLAHQAQDVLVKVGAPQYVSS